MQISIPEEFVTRVDFKKFWEFYIRGPLTIEKLRQAKRDLLNAGVLPMTAHDGYFLALHRTLACEGGNEGLVEPIMDELLALTDEEDSLAVTA
jgi:hypothetical protein